MKTSGQLPVNNLKDKGITLSKMLHAYQTAVNAAAIVSITDFKGNIIYVNEKFLEISGYSKEELMGKSHRIINSGHHDRVFFEEMWQTIAAGKSWRGQIKNKAKDGSFYWVDTVITPVKDDEENIHQYLSIRNLITVQKNYEEALITYSKTLVKKGQQLKDAQQVAKTGSWHLDIPGNLLEWSEETYHIFEIKPGAVITYELFISMVHPDDKQEVEKCWREAGSTGQYDVEHRILTASGVKWVRERAHFEFDNSTNIKKALGTVQDITEKKKIENDLKRSEIVYKSLFNSSPNAIGIVDKQHLKFLRVNETGAKLYGYSTEEFLKLSVFDLRVPWEHDKLTSQFKSGKYAFDNSARQHLKKNGEIIWVEPYITEIVYENTPAYLATIHDVTDKKRVEQELLQAAELRNMEVTRATLEAEEKSRSAIGRELHDNINQLLVASTLFLKKAKPFSEKSISLLETGLGIIEKAITEIRILSSQFVPPSFKVISLDASIRYLAESFRLTGTLVDFDIKMDESTLPDTLKINLYRIVQEQFNNIIKYAEATRVTVKIKQVNNLLTLSVRDNGNGFDQQKKGKGIGFTNILHRAEAYNGKLVIESDLNNGCRIKIHFDLTPGDK